MLVATASQTDPEHTHHLVPFVTTLHVTDRDDLLADTHGPDWLEECLRDSGQSGPDKTG